MMRIHSKAFSGAIRATNRAPNSFVGVLFRFGEVSGNKTVVQAGASIRVAGDALLVEHKYLGIDEYKPAGRISKFYIRNGALLAEFTVDVDGVIDDGKRFLSVSWFSDNYTVKDYDGESVIEFADVVIYEVSLVAAPAFNTCIATKEEGLSCLSSLGGCGCGGKCGSVSLGDMVAKHQEVTREEFEALRDSVTQIQDAIAVLSGEIENLKKTIEQPPADVIQELEQAKQKLSELELELSTQSNSLGNTLTMLERLLNITERTYKNLPNIVKR